MAARLDPLFRRFRHIELVSDKIAQAIMRGGARLIVSMPPRHGKSWLLSKWTPAWFLSHFPHKRVILASYASEFASTWGRAVRDTVGKYPQLGLRLNNDVSAADGWALKTTGPGEYAMRTAGIGGPITGMGGDLLIVDDYCKNSAEADSAAYRKQAADWWDTTFYSRAEPGASIIVLATRWHAGDLIGHILASETRDQWEYINLPAIAEDENDQLGRPIGQALCQERYDEKALDLIRGTVGTRAWFALYQGRPSSEQGNIVKRAWWKYWDALPAKFDELIISGDLSFTGKTKSDRVSMQVWGRIGAQKYLVDRIKGVMGFTKSIEMFITLINRWPNAKRRLIENKANGPALEDQLKKHIPGIILVEPRGDKIARLYAVTPTMEAGDCYLPPKSRFPWVDDYENELADFPNGAFDDDVDATSQALQYFEKPRVYHMPIAGHGSY